MSARRRGGVAPGLRIAGGSWRGRRLRGAPGSRPTQERVREAVMSAWRDRLPRARMLDLYCGAGAVGLEALGRGAAFCGFVDAREESLSVLDDNAAALGIRVERARLELPAELRRLPAAWGERFDLIWADPPYDAPHLESLAEALAPRLAERGEAAIEHSSRRAPAPGPLVVDRTRRYGETTVTFLRAPAATVGGIPSDG